MKVEEAISCDSRRKNHEIMLAAESKFTQKTGRLMHEQQVAVKFFWHLGGKINHRGVSNEMNILHVKKFWQNFREKQFFFTNCGYDFRGWE